MQPRAQTMRHILYENESMRSRDAALLFPEPRGAHAGASEAREESETRGPRRAAARRFASGDLSWKFARFLLPDYTINALPPPQAIGSLCVCP